MCCKNDRSHFDARCVCVEKMKCDYDSSCCCGGARSKQSLRDAFDVELDCLIRVVHQDYKGFQLFDTKVMYHRKFLALL